MMPTLDRRRGVGLLVLLACALSGLAQTPPASADREMFSLDQGWRFHLGDIPFPVVSGHRESYNNAKAGRASGAAAADYDDTGWRGVDLPHDWVVEGPFVKGENPSQGYRPRGIAWYRVVSRGIAGISSFPSRTGVATSS